MSDNERPRLQRSEEQLRETLRMLCHFVWNGKPKEGDHVWSIPADNERDFDLILADAISELVELRAKLAAAEQREAKLQKHSDWLGQLLNETRDEMSGRMDRMNGITTRLTAENQKLKEMLVEINRLASDRADIIGEKEGTLRRIAALAKKEPSDAH